MVSKSIGKNFAAVTLGIVLVVIGLFLFSFLTDFRNNNTNVSCDGPGCAKIDEENVAAGKTQTRNNIIGGVIGALPVLAGVLIIITPAIAKKRGSSKI